MFMGEARLTGLELMRAWCQEEERELPLFVEHIVEAAIRRPSDSRDEGSWSGTTEPEEVKITPRRGPS